MSSSNNSNFISPENLKLKPLYSQVAGHPSSVFTSEDDILVIKKSLKKEIDFYNHIIKREEKTSSDDDDLKNQLRKYLPEYFGQTLIPSTKEVKGQEDAKGKGKGKGEGEGEGEKEEAIVIENLTSSKKFKKPNTLDIKLGTQLWDEDDVTEEKKIRMEKVSKETTSGETGIRLTGWQTHSTNSSESKNISTSKSFGKSIEKKFLINGLRLFFCVPNSKDPFVREEVLLKSISNQKEISTSFLESETNRLKEETLNPSRFNSPKLISILLKSGLLPKLKEIRKIFQSLECRIRGGSLLIIFEGDEEIVENQLLKSNHDAISIKDLGKDDKLADDKVINSLIDVRIIDFAHFKFCKGFGIDEGVLKGIDSLIGLIQEILVELENGSSVNQSKG